MTIAGIALRLLVIARSIQTGAGLFETRVLVPLWVNSPPASVRAYHATAIKAGSERRLWIFKAFSYGAGLS